jgi:exopolysaccharide biosynthesis polyprenyl glycosylphosphotransferase
MLRQFSTKRILGFFLLDWLGTLLVLVSSFFFRTRFGSLPSALIQKLDSLNISVGVQGEVTTGIAGVNIAVLILVAVLWPFFFISFSVYDGRRNPTLLNELRNVFIAICVSGVALSGLLFLTYRETSRLIILIFLLADLVLLLGSRCIFYFYRLFWKNKDGVGRRRVLIVGAGEVGRKIVDQLEKFGRADAQIIGFLDDAAEKQGQDFHDIPVLGTLDQIADVVAKNQVQDAVIALPSRAHERLVSICVQLQKLSVRVHVIPDILEVAFPNNTLDGFGGIPVIDLGSPGVEGVKQVVKRIFDLVVGSIILVLVSPLLLVVAILIRLDSPGPVIYKQPRVGKNGRIFTMFKFRSMRPDSDISIHKNHVTRLIQQNLNPEQLSGNKNGNIKLEDDPRITRVGRFIRKHSIDEVPQLFNVLRGEMSLVGPRPDVPYAVELYKDWHKRRFECLPGMTGWWQVKGHNRVSYDEMMRMDIYYIEHMSLWMDIKILFLTPMEVIFGKGSG